MLYSVAEERIGPFARDFSVGKVLSHSHINVFFPQGLGHSKLVQCFLLSGHVEMAFSDAKCTV